MNCLLLKHFITIPVSDFYSVAFIFRRCVWPCFYRCESFEPDLSYNIQYFYIHVTIFQHFDHCDALNIGVFMCRVYCVLQRIRILLDLLWLSAPKQAHKKKHLPSTCPFMCSQKKNMRFSLFFIFYFRKTGLAHLSIRSNDLFLLFMNCCPLPNTIFPTIPPPLPTHSYSLPCFGQARQPKTTFKILYDGYD